MKQATIIKTGTKYANFKLIFNPLPYTPQYNAKISSENRKVKNTTPYDTHETYTLKEHKIIPASM